MSEEESSEAGLLQMLIKPNRTLASWYIGLGLWGLFLAILNIMGQIHPNYRVSWGGLLSFELTNAAFETTDEIKVVASDFIFIVLCAGVTWLGLQTMADDKEGIKGFFMSIFLNDLWNSLVSTEDGGWMRTAAAWCLVIGFDFYIIWSILYQTWIDPGVYAVSAALIAFGFALKTGSEAPEATNLTE